ncbi:unnamed protein product [Symbiodinium sp. CCMP2592]|nr:unnamed protein product [Symbiodinium sp. CCMP2592]
MRSGKAIFRVILLVPILEWLLCNPSRAWVKGPCATQVRVSGRLKLLRVQGVFNDGEVSAFKQEQLVPVEAAWRELLTYIIVENQRTAVIRAPPRSGKSFLGILGARKVPAGMWGSAEVRYCANFDPGVLDILTRRGNFNSVAEMAKDSAESGSDCDRATVVYYFDEAHELPAEIINSFIKNGEDNGYAIFATAGRATPARSFVTPPELVAKTLFFRSPAPKAAIKAWLADRLRQLVLDDDTATASADLLLNGAAGNIGVVTFFAVQLEQKLPSDKSLRILREVREILAKLTSEFTGLYIRIFGTENGKPDDTQAELISSMRCTGSLMRTTPAGEALPLWDPTMPSHRYGLSNAYYTVCAPEDEDGCLAQASAAETISFVHPVQPEIYADKFKLAWHDISLEQRWLTNFSRDHSDPANTPANVIDLVLSWLSHVPTKTLLSIHGGNNVDAPESGLQVSLYEFCRDTLSLQQTVQREASSSSGGKLDLYIDGSMGVELLIRPSNSNKIATQSVLRNAATRESLLEHARRGDESYKDLSQQCRLGYITVFVTTLTQSTADAEWEHFQNLSSTTLVGLGYPVLVAVANFGWAKWDVFLHRPRLTPIRFFIPRQRLMLKLIDDKPVSARSYYCKPQEVWVQELQVNENVHALVGEVLLIESAPNLVAQLARRIKTVAGLSWPLPKLAIYRLNWQNEWEKEAADQVLFENTRNSPYGFRQLP